MCRARTSAAIAFAVLCALAQGALAERADRDKPVHLEADRVTLDDAKQMAVFSGDVQLTQGTLSISADQVIATQGPKGFEHGTATGTPAHFRQKRDGADEYVEGWGQRIEYDAVRGVMDIYGQAHVKRGLDDARGDHITYNARDLNFKIVGAQTPAQNKRVTVTINPKTPSSGVETAEPLGIQPDTRLIKQDDKQ